MVQLGHGRQQLGHKYLHFYFSDPFICEPNNEQFSIMIFSEPLVDELNRDNNVYKESLPAQKCKINRYHDLQMKSITNINSYFRTLTTLYSYCTSNTITDRCIIFSLHGLEHAHNHINMRCSYSR